MMIIDDETDLRFDELEARLRDHLAERQTLTTKTVVPLIEKNQPPRHRRLAFLAVAAALSAAAMWSYVEVKPRDEISLPNVRVSATGLEEEMSDGSDSAEGVRGDWTGMEIGLGANDVVAKDILEERLGISYEELERRFLGRPYEELDEFVGSADPGSSVEPVVSDQLAFHYGYRIYRPLIPDRSHSVLPLLPPGSGNRVLVEVDSDGVVVAIGGFD